MMTKMVKQPFSISPSLKLRRDSPAGLTEVTDTLETGKSLGDRLRRQLGAAAARP